MESRPSRARGLKREYDFMSLNKIHRVHHGRVD